MHGCIRKWLARTLAAAAFASGPAIGLAQQDAPAYADYVGQGVPAQTVSEELTAPADSDLAARVKKLEEALKKADEKAAADKKAAAGKPTAQIGGMIQMDYNLFNQSPANITQFGDAQDGVAFRRARLWVTGTGFDIMEYKLEVDFAPFLQTSLGTAPYFNGGNINTAPATFGGWLQQTGARDIYVQLNDLAYLGHVRMGHFKEPFGLEQLTSDRFITFMERSLPDEGCIVPARSIGIMAFDNYACDYGTWSTGAFRVFTRDTLTSDGWVRQSDEGGTAWTSRVTYLPWYDEATEGRGLLHIGGSYSYRDMDTLTANAATSNPTSYFESAKPEAYLAPSVVAATLTDVEHSELFGGEAALVYGSFSVQSEYFGAYLHRNNGVTNYQWGGYAYMSYFLTGENRVYNKANGAFDRVKPYENFFRVRGEDCNVYTGKGAWEVGYRWSYIDLGLPAAGQGGLAMDNTFGVNWYLNPNLRMMWNYVHTDCDPIQKANTTKSSIDTFEMRMALDF